MKKKIYSIICMLFFLFPIVLKCSAGKLELLRTIGNDSENYTIFGLADAIISDNKDIYILNARGNFISIYDWEGNFKKQIGQKGQGPGDYSFPRSLDYFNDSLFILDKGNKRIVEFNTINNEYKIYRNEQKVSFGNHFAVLNNNEFLGVFLFADEIRGRIGVVDKEGNLIRSFFDETPINIDYVKGSLEDANSIEKMARVAAASSYFQPIFSISPGKNKILVSYKLPNNPVLFYVYDINGNLKNKFSYIIDDKKYKFTDFFFKAPVEKMRNVNQWPDRNEPQLDAICIYNDYYLAFLSLRSYVKKEMIDCKNFCLVFDTKGVLKDRFPIKSSLRLIRYSNGYFLGTDSSEDIEKLYIFRMTLE